MKEAETEKAPICIRKSAAPNNYGAPEAGTVPCGGREEKSGGALTD